MPIRIGHLLKTGNQKGLHSSVYVKNEAPLLRKHSAKGDIYDGYYCWNFRKSEEAFF